MVPSILIVGAGPTGLTAALELARRGIVPRLIDKRPTPSSFSRAVGILPSSVEIFRRSGVDRAITGEAVVFRGGILHDRDRPVLHIALNEDAATRIWGLPQDRTEHHLAEALSRYGGTVEYGHELETLEELPDHVEAVVNGEARRYDLVIGADGVRSGVRGALGLGFDGYDLPEDWSIADVDAPEWRAKGFFMGYLMPGGEVVVVVPLSEQRYRIVASAPDALAALPVAMPATEVRRTGGFRISVRQVARYQTGRVFLAGDAAHCHSPVGGRGMNLGIADAADLADRIVAGDLSGYHAARYAVGQSVIRETERARRLIQARSALGHRAVLTALRTIDAVPALRQALARRLFTGGARL